MWDIYNQFSENIQLNDFDLFHFSRRSSVFVGHVTEQPLYFMPKKWSAPNVIIHFTKIALARMQCAMIAMRQQFCRRTSQGIILVCILVWFFWLKAGVFFFFFNFSDEYVKLKRFVADWFSNEDVSPMNDALIFYPNILIPFFSYLLNFSMSVWTN